jgi:purine-binding chemotaxis protein CheW
MALNRKEKAAATLMEMCTVRLGTSLFGVPITHILEIVGAARPQPVPLAPVFVGGLVHYRGDVLITVSLRQLLGLTPKEGRQDLLVLTVSSSDYEPNPSILDERRRALFAGAYKLKDGLLVMLDPERLDPMRLGAVQAA